ncbi:MAG: hypothetical protein AAGE52_02345 [Myxococcota bacterium]
MSYRWLWVLAFALAFGCDPATTGPVRPGSDGGTADGGGGPPGGCQRRDSDGDGIDDGWESSDAEDTDGDGFTDAEEAGTDPCVPPDTDGDGTPDFADTDSDNDGLSDARERELGTNPRAIDSDGDGVTDLGEVDGTGTDPTDPTSTIDMDDFFVVLPFGTREARRLQFGTNITLADVFFLVDMTGSMQQERTNLIQGLLDTIIPGIQGAIRDVQFGAGGMDDYPVTPVGGGNDLPFYLLREIAPPEQDLGAWSLAATPTSCPRDAATNDIGRIQGAPNGTPDILEAVQGLPCHGGGDGPESYTPALWASATGMGLSWPGGSIPDQTCPTIPDEDGVRRGYPCFRPGALPIFLLFGDANWHNDSMNNDTYSFPAPSYAETVDALNGIGARVISIWSQQSGRDDYEAIGRDTGTVDGSGNPLVFDINANGSGLGAAVVDAVASLVGGTPQDVSTRTENVPGNPDDFDATTFIKSITPVEGYREGVPGVGYDSFDETTFYNVIPGTIVEFTIDFFNDVRPPAEVAQIFQARIIVVGNGVADLDSRNVYIVVPPDGVVILI